MNTEMKPTFASIMEREPRLSEDQAMKVLVLVNAGLPLDGAIRHVLQERPIENHLSD